MTIEIAGAGFLNKGAELMLRTTVMRLRSRHPNLRLAIQPGADSRFEQRAALGLAAIFPSAPVFPDAVRRLMLRSSFADTVLSWPLRMLMPRAGEQVLGLVDRRRCEALVDISGYAFGDGFSWTKCSNAAARSRVYSKRGRPVIYLPQMFGPFTHSKVAKYFKRCCDEATRIYARDQASFDALCELVGRDDRLRIAPDITIFGSEDLQTPTDATQNLVGCLVPNQKMLERGRKEWGDSYLARLVAAGERMHAHGIRPVVVGHSAEDADERIGHELSDALEEKLGKDGVGRYSHDDPYELKKFIAASAFLVGSRYHSIVAALSTGVPAVLLGWAHKYDMLALDFAVGELQHRGTDCVEHLLSLVDLLSDKEVNQRYRDRILARREEMRASSDAMWQDVYTLLRLAK